MSYDTNNIFAKMVRGEIKPQVVYEDDKVLAFHDIHPKQKVHVLIIPKGSYSDISHFGDDAQTDEIDALIRAVPKVAEVMGIKQNGYRLVINCGEDGGQEVPHLHIHMLGGEAL